MLIQTNKNLDFLSDEKIINLVNSILTEIDVVSSVGAHRSTTYLSVSAIEGLFDALIQLKDINASNLPTWPQYKDKIRKGVAKKFDDLTLEDKEYILRDVNALHPDFTAIYQTVRKFRNYMHPEREIRNKTPITQSIGQLTLASLNALIEQFEFTRFIANHEWKLIYGLARVPNNRTIHMPQNPGQYKSLLVSDKKAGSFKELRFRVVVPNEAIFNFIYNYFSPNKFMGARIEGRVGIDGRGSHNGRLIGSSLDSWSINAQYTANTEPDPKKQEHTVRVVMQPQTAFAIYVDNVQLILRNGTDWEYNPEGQIGFLTELVPVSIVDVEFDT